MTERKSDEQNVHNGPLTFFVAASDFVVARAADRYVPAAHTLTEALLPTTCVVVNKPSALKHFPTTGAAPRLSESRSRVPRNRRSDVPLRGACRGRGAGRWQAAWNIADRGDTVSGVGCPACTMNQIGDSGFCRGDYRDIQTWFCECPKGIQSKPLFLHRRSDGLGYQSPVAFRQGLL